MSSWGRNTVSDGALDRRRFLFIVVKKILSQLDEHKPYQEHKNRICMSWKNPNTSQWICGELFSFYCDVIYMYQGEIL
jgi:hypothetical protein